MPEVGEKMPSQITNNTAVYSKFCAISNQKKKVIDSSHTETAKSFLYRRTLKQMKQKRSSGNVLVVHLFPRLSVLLHQVSKKQHRMKKNGVTPDATTKQKRRNFENQKTPFAVAKK